MATASVTVAHLALGQFESLRTLLEEIIHVMTLTVQDETEVAREIRFDPIQQLSKVRDDWIRITRFFRELAVEINFNETFLRVLHRILQDFLAVFGKVQPIDLRLNPVNQRLYVMFLVSSTTVIRNVSHRVYSMTKANSDISKEYLIDPAMQL